MNAHAEGPRAGPVVDGASRFVQLPTDHPRAATAEIEVAVLPLDGQRALAGEPAFAVAALAAWLHRYSHQPLVGVDLLFVDAEEHPRRSLTWSGRTDGDVLLQSLIDDVTAALQQGGPARSTDPASVAMSFEADAAAGDDALPFRPHYDLQFVFSRSAAPFVRYNAKLFARDTAQSFLDSFALLVDGAQRARAAPLRALPLLTPAAAAVVTLDGPRVEPEHNTVHERFMTLARNQPDAPALYFQEQCMTYGELDRRSNQLAHWLFARGVTPGVHVGVCVKPSFDVLVALLAVFKAGGVYMPLDPTHPEKLVASMLEEAQPAILLTQSTCSDATRTATCPRMLLDTEWSAASGPGTHATSAVDVAPSLERAAYLLYTSGTTGKPKGVIARHENLAHYIGVARDMYRFVASDVFCALARYTFSISMWELLSPLCCGGSLHLLERDDVLTPSRLSRVLEKITVLHAGPSLLGSLFRFLKMSPGTTAAFASMRHASSGGDLVQPSIQEEMKATFPNAEIWIIYGSTEISCMGATYRVQRDVKPTCSFVGKPFPNVTMRVVDEHGAQVPVGVVGEIWFSGRGVVPGYYQRAELDREKFREAYGGRYYTMGDLGRAHASGDVEILGRRDYQVQLRGIRIELVGIENTIRELGLAAAAALVMKKGDESDAKLVAFVMKPRETDIIAFRKELRDHLPDYMLPHVLVPIEALPLTHNGKLDRAKLATLSWQDANAASLSSSSPGGAPGAQKVAPTNAVEQQIVAAFASTLNVSASDIGIDDDFFDRGGDSLSAVMMMLELENVAGFSFSPDAMFTQSTPRALAALASSSPDTVRRPILLNKNRDGPAIFMLLGVHVYRALAQLLEDKYAVYGVFVGDEIAMFDDSGDARKVPSVQNLAAQYIETIRRQQAKGPYRVTGMSFGGLVAFEVMRQLQAAGETVEFVGMLDAVLPEVGFKGKVSRAARLAALGGGEVAKRIGERVRSFADRARARPGPETFLRHAADNPLGRLERARARAYRVAAEEYVRVLGKEHIRTSFSPTLIVSGTRLRADPLAEKDCGWTGTVPRVRVHTVDADHLALVEEPRVREVAAIFRNSMETPS